MLFATKNSLAFKKAKHIAEVVKLPNMSQKYINIL